MLPQRNIRLTLAYDGTNYVGWQVQKNGLSIQEVRLEEKAGGKSGHFQREDPPTTAVKNPGSLP